MYVYIIRRSMKEHEKKSEKILAISTGTYGTLNRTVVKKITRVKFVSADKIGTVHYGTVPL